MCVLAWGQIVPANMNRDGDIGLQAFHAGFRTTRAWSMIRRAHVVGVPDRLQGEGAYVTRLWNFYFYAVCGYQSLA